MSPAHNTADGRAVTPQELNLLELFSANTRSIWLPHTVSRNNLVKAGYIEWVPSYFGGSLECDYAITDAGRAALSAAKGVS